MKTLQDPRMVGHASDGRLVRRPLSPHLQVYRWPVTMAGSILNRMTGVALCAGALMLVWWLVAAAAGPQAFATMQGFAGSWLGLLLLLGWTASLFYHLFAGIRHLAWDTGHGFEKSTLNPVTWAVFGLTAAATALTWIVGLSVW